MTAINEVVKKKQGYTLHIVQTDKYKTNSLILKMKAPLDQETVTLRGLLPHVMQSSTKTYPSTTELRSYLDELYGANFFTDLGKKGEYHVVSMSVEIANEKFLRDSEPLLQKGIEFLADVLQNPHIENNEFDKKTVEKEKRNQKVRIQAVYDDKMRYANSRLVEEMCKGERFALHVNGISEEVESITAKSLYEYYQKVMNEDQFDLYVIGDVDVAEVEKLCDQLLQLKERTPLEVDSSVVEQKERENVVKEKQDVKQGKLNIGYRTHTQYGDDDYFALQVFNGIFGGFSHSKLFINVREKASLAYYAASRLESHKGLLMVMSGIEFEKYDQAVGIINDQLQAMKDGDFTDGEIEQTKAVIRNQLLETIDTSRGLVEVLYHNAVAHEEIDLKHWLEEIEKTTKEDIVKAANKVELDTIYFLTGMEG
ncbi:EF-P 5-aminopentanol modification-associated protein YfmF [Rossellomorea aquimaris]|uniref:Insulinase family protein n=1 Tax=Rossellomorea aquimaris TaxID=189382 RepID=A0A5D4TTX5_9BACI|nr:pitrilysin family protein [Rossellomorea aquimaris]TYS79137.1 insulinase family protein [Rossellomorea aquimaris]TYS84883.1 insulinase family protein [Rossellomorea aquimaris]